MKLEQEERVALARIVYDLVESDSIVEKGEIMSLNEIVSNQYSTDNNAKDFNVTWRMFSDAKKKTFAEAVTLLSKNINERDKNYVIDILKEASLSDGSCVPLEALLIMAVKYALVGKCRVYSVPGSNNFIEPMQVVYIENKENTDVDSYIRNHYRAICNEFRLGGFDFVYIPQIINDYSQIEGDYLKDVIRYMIPDIEDFKIDVIQHKLSSMTTSRFCQNYLYDVLGMDLLCSKPAFLFKVGDSAVTDKRGKGDLARRIYSNFFLVPVEETILSGNNGGSKTILEYVVELMDFYRSMVSHSLTIENRSLSKKFIYYGFHRSLFDLIAYGKERSDYKIVVASSNSCVVLRPVNYDFNREKDDDNDLILSLRPREFRYIC